MREIRGIAASPGTAAAVSFLFYEEEEQPVPSYAISADAISGEWNRFMEAVTLAKADVSQLRDRALHEAGSEQAAIFESHLLMLDDPDIIDRIQESLAHDLMNIERIVLDLERELVEKLSSIQDPFVQERISDVHDVSRRIMGHLLKRERFCLADIETDVILVARDLLPSDMISMNRTHVKAVVTEAGGRTSHAAILARAFRIPAVLGIGEEAATLHSGTMLVVDGERGTVIADPDRSALSAVESRTRARSDRDLELESLAPLASETRDGKRILLKANIEIPEELDLFPAYNPDGIGLFRSEFLFLGGHIPGEEEQFNAYRKVLEGMKGLPVTIRTLDIGGDKVLPELGAQDEKNPLLGWRAIRFCLGRPDIFKTQLRALLRASTYGDLRIMFPMISTVDELYRARGLLEEARSECRTRGYEVAERIPVGIMIEVPSAAIISDVLARTADFFSIGTNDLVQYTMAVDRGNEKISYLQELYHPAVLRLIKMTLDAARKCSIPVSLCGEMAADPKAAVLLAGMGMEELSMSCASIPGVKRAIRSISSSTSDEIARVVLGMSSSSEINDYLEARVRP